MADLPGQPRVAPEQSPAQHHPQPYARAHVQHGKVVDAAGEAGLYVSVMIGQGWTVHQDAAWADHPFNAGNNVNGIASNPAEVQSLSNPKIVA